ncbi:type IV secretion system protein [Microvirga tunisiensis]|uniref:Uncharacterized protein n=1 Tax=Microvirga tunisiensis TaxID=2108360 RepID=A0A5N7MWE0_9HYPH|nr:type IV secretion system protein [Microvirga tunisiensis]MPR10160.1 hypothetical protein [Microvirga tunisiensis]MPR28366.1 hypothetical protein [Microvirga tunisiensis]
MKVVPPSVVLSGLLLAATGPLVQEVYAQETFNDNAVQLLIAAVSGRKPFPVNNGEADVAARKGGSGLWEMANAALSCETVGPGGIQETLTEFCKRYGLSNAFKLRNDKLVSNVNIAQASAQGAITASIAEESYKRANASMGRINGYIAALETSSDLKTSVDINTRVMTEVAQQLNETLRTQAAIASAAGSYLMVFGADAAQQDGVGDPTDFIR